MLVHKFSISSINDEGYLETGIGEITNLSKHFERYGRKAKVILTHLDDIHLEVFYERKQEEQYNPICRPAFDWLTLNFSDILDGFDMKDINPNDLAAPEGQARVGAVLRRDVFDRKIAVAKKIWERLVNFSQFNDLVYHSSGIRREGAIKA